LTYRLFFCGENLVAVGSIVQKWAWFDLKWAWSEIFRVRNHIFSPPNLQYLPTPMQISAIHNKRALFPCKEP